MAGALLGAWMVRSNEHHRLVVDVATPQAHGDGRIAISLAALVLALRVLWLTRRQKINEAIPA